MSEHLLEVRDLKTYFRTGAGILRAVDGISFHIRPGETLGVVGESGCGKSVTALSIMRLIPVPPGMYVGGEILFRGEDLLRKTNEEMRRVRGNEVGMIFQEPMTSLNPVFPLGDQIAEAIEVHRGLSRKEALAKARVMLDLVGVPDSERRLREYPHQLSGGMRQRVMIAMALCGNPKLLIADEPTTALDVTIQAQILELIRGLKQELGMAIMLITHDLGVIAEMAERVVVMYLGRIVEESAVRPFFRQPLHPYSEGLLRCIPRLDHDVDRLEVIAGLVPSPIGERAGCGFAPRCRHTQQICWQQEPLLRDIGERRVACHFNPDERRLTTEVVA